MRRALALALVLLAGCNGAARDTQPKFPPADRAVAPIVSSRWSNEEARDRVDESDKVMDLAGIDPGKTVADIGAGEGYYTIRLAERVGAKGRVLAQDIVPAVRDKLAERVNRERLDNVSVKLGEPGNPMLPHKSFDRVLLIHMYHEIASPYEFLWHLHPALKAGGRVVIVDADRPTNDHGTPPLLLQCEMEAVGFRLVEFQQAAFAGGYFAAFDAGAKRPAPDAIRPCALAKKR